MIRKSHSISSLGKGGQFRLEHPNGVTWDFWGGSNFEIRKNIVNPIFIIGANGNVGIPSAGTDKLNVVGDIRVGTTGSNGCLNNFSGTAIAGSCSSDSRLKKDITPLTNALEKVVELTPSFYSWRADEFPGYAFGKETQLGLIAQDVEQVLPNLVGGDANGYKTVSYGVELQMYIIQAIKEQQLQITALQEQNAELAARLAALENR